MLNERKFTDQQTNRDERAIDSLLKQAQLSSHSGDGTSKFSQMARDRAALLRKTQKHLKKSKRLRDSVEYEEDVINEDDFAEGVKDQFKMAGISGRLARPMKDKVKGDLKSGDVRTARDSSRDIHPDDMSDIQALHKRGDKAGISRIIAARNKMDKPMGESVINEEDPHVSADPRHPANQRNSDQSGSGRTHPYVHTNPHTGKKVRTRLGGATHIHPKTGASQRTDGVFDSKTKGIPTQVPVTDSERKRLKTANEGVSDIIKGAYGAAKKLTGKFDDALDNKTKGFEKRVDDKFNKPAKTKLGKLGQKLFNSVEYPIEAGESNEGYGPGPSYGKKGLKGFRRFESKPGKVDELNTSTLKSYISKANKSADNSMDTAMDGDTRREREDATHTVNRRRKGVRNAKDIIKQRASDAALDWENSDDGMDSRVIST